MMMFAIVFGLSMDYEVFLLSRIKEEWTSAPATTATSVADGLAKTARVITAAAAIMVFVFGSFLLESEPRHQAVRPRPGQRRAPRRHRRPHAAGAGHDGAAGRPELVAAAAGSTASCPNIDVEGSHRRSTTKMPPPVAGAASPVAALHNRAAAPPLASAAASLGLLVTALHNRCCSETAAALRRPGSLAIASPASAALPPAPGRCAPQPVLLRRRPPHCGGPHLRSRPEAG